MLYSVTNSSPYSLRLNGPSVSSSSSNSNSPRLERQSKKDALNSLTHFVSPRLEKQSSSLDFQDVQLKGKVNYLYEAQSKENGKQEYVIPFPIFRVQNNCFLQGSLTAQIQQPHPRPTCESLAQAIRNNITVYGRQAFHELESKCKPISKTFYHATKDPIQVQVTDLSQDEEGKCHFDFQVTLVFGSETVSKASQVFWTLKLQDVILSEDVLIEKDAKDRNKKIEGTHKFEAWEKEACWYREYKDLLTTLRQHPSDEEVKSKESSEEFQNEEDAAYEAPPSPSPVLTRKHRKNLVLSDDSLPLPSPPLLSMTALPAEGQTSSDAQKSAAQVSAEKIEALIPTIAALPAEVQPSLKTQKSTAQVNAKKIEALIPTILDSLQAQAEIEKQDKAQIEQLTQQLTQLVHKEHEEQALKHQLEQKLRDAQTEFSTLQAREQELTAEVTRLQDALIAVKSQERTPSPTPTNSGDLQERLDDANNAYRGLKISYNKKREELQKKTDQLAIAEKAIEDYKKNLNQANQAVTELKEIKQKLEEILDQEKNKNKTFKQTMGTLKAESQKHGMLKVIHNDVKKQLIDVRKQKEDAETNLKLTCAALAESKRSADHLKFQLHSTTQDLKKEQTENSFLKRKLEQTQQQIIEKEEEVNHQKRLRTETELKSKEQIQALNQQLQDKEKAEAQLKTELDTMRAKWTHVQKFFLNGTGADH